jgi:hypothetical protein
MGFDLERENSLDMMLFGMRGLATSGAFGIAAILNYGGERGIRTLAKRLKTLVVSGDDTQNNTQARKLSASPSNRNRCLASTQGTAASRHPCNCPFGIG